MNEEREFASRYRIAHITTAHCADDPRILFREAAALREAGWDVVVVGPAAASGNIAGVPVLATRRISNRMVRALSATFLGLRAVWRSEAALAHFHDRELLPAALLSRWLLRRKAVFDSHEDVSLFAVRDSIPRWMKKPLTAVIGGFDRFFASRLDGVVAPTRLLQDRYRSIAPRTETFVNYPAPAFLRARDAAWVPWRQRRREVLHVGTLRVSRLRFLVEVARRFLDQHRDWTWTFVGMHPPVREWFERNVTGDIRQRLFGEAMVSHLEIADRLCHARLGVNFHPLDSPHIRVAIPLKVFEYLACGLPVVTTRVPLLMELVQDCPAVRICPETAGEYEAALDALASGEDRSDLSETARMFSDTRFNCGQEAQRLADLYRRILVE